MRDFWLLVFVLLLPAAVSAQEAGAASPQPFRKWDAGGGFGIGKAYDVVVPGLSGSAELSRYWTAHLKTTVEVATADTMNTAYTYDGRVSRQTSTTTGPAAFSSTLGYQFFENIFVHPYLVGGVRMVSESDSTQTYLSVPPYGVVSTETHPSRLLARPVLGGGVKSYFGNGRAFMRSELLLVIDPHGSPHGVFQLGVGIDF